MIYPEHLGPLRHSHPADNRSEVEIGIESKLLTRHGPSRRLGTVTPGHAGALPGRPCSQGQRTRARPADDNPEGQKVIEAVVSFRGLALNGSAPRPTPARACDPGRIGDTHPCRT
jgi:hypothetical protein